MSLLLTLTSGIPILSNVAGIGNAYDTYTTLASSISAGGTYTLPSGATYTTGVSQLQVFIDGIAQTSGLDYTESSITQITLQKTVNAGQTIRIRK
jgi:hypothetical protein